MTQETAPLFESAYSALVFALNFSGQAYDRPLMNRLAAPAIGTGKGLAGLDGAAQAGFIRAEVAALGRIAEAIITARFAPRSVTCSCRAPCCSGRKENNEWVNAIAALSDHIRTTALVGCTSNGLMRRDYVRRYFTRKTDRAALEDIAGRYKIDRNTSAAHYKRVVGLFAGSGTQPGLENLAVMAAEDRMIAAGMVEGR